MPRKAAEKGSRRGERKFSVDRLEATDVLDVSDDENESNGAEEDQDSMLEMIALVKEFQKRKTSKNTAKSAAFEAKKDALFTEARKNAANAVKEGIAYIEQYKIKIAELKAREVSQDHHLKDLALFRTREDTMQTVLSSFPPLFDGLSHRRADAINETSAMLESHAVERHQSRRRLIKHARARIDEEQENQRIATDATALIKHYKALLLS